MSLESQRMERAESECVSMRCRSMWNWRENFKSNPRPGSRGRSSHGPVVAPQATSRNSTRNHDDRLLTSSNDILIQAFSRILNHVNFCGISTHFGRTRFTISKRSNTVSNSRRMSRGCRTSSKPSPHRILTPDR